MSSVLYPPYQNSYLIVFINLFWFHEPDGPPIQHKMAAFSFMWNLVLAYWPATCRGALKTPSSLEPRITELTFHPAKADIKAYWIVTCHEFSDERALSQIKLSALIAPPFWTTMRWFISVIIYIIVYCLWKWGVTESSESWEVPLPCTRLRILSTHSHLALQ